MTHSNKKIKEEVEKMLANRNNFGQWKVFELEAIYKKYKGMI